jgi:radical SAM superfamily enzyme YgiQ (UPF0313 family)
MEKGEQMSSSMKVLFTNPPWWGNQVPRVYRKRFTPIKRSVLRWERGVRSGSRWPHTFLGASSPGNPLFGDYLPFPFFLSYATSYAERGIMGRGSVVMRDSIARAETYEDFYSYLAQEEFTHVIIESASPSWEHDQVVIKKIAEILPQAQIAVAGPISTLGKEILETLPVKAVLKGEFEKNSLKFLNGQLGVIEHDLLTVEEMNSSPYPAFDEDVIKMYSDHNPHGQVFPHFQIWSSRGCPFKCIFCVWPATMTGNDPDGLSRRTVRYYSPEYVEGLIKYGVEKFGFKSIYFDDDTFNLGTSHVRKMCEIMKRVNLPWSAMCRADTIKMELWQEMKDSGCFGVKLGFESGDQNVVDKIVNKHLDLEYAGNVVKHLKKIGMTVHGTFTYGLPGETIENMKRTKQYIKSLPFDSVQESGTAEIEGTPLARLRSVGSLEAYPDANMPSITPIYLDGRKRALDVIQELREVEK